MLNKRQKQTSDEDNRSSLLEKRKKETLEQNRLQNNRRSKLTQLNNELKRRKGLNRYGDSSSESAEEERSDDDSYEDEEAEIRQSQKIKRKEKKLAELKGEPGDDEKEEIYNSEHKELQSKVQELLMKRNEIIRLLSKQTIFAKTMKGLFVRVPYQVKDNRQYHIGRVEEVLEKKKAYVVREVNKKGQTVERTTNMYLMVNIGEPKNFEFLITKVSQDYVTVSWNELNSYFAKNELKKSDYLAKKRDKEMAQHAKITDKDIFRDDLAKYESKFL